MKTALASPAKLHRARWALAQQGGCIACRRRGMFGVPGDVHHLLSRGRRISHDATVILCPWHHRGVAPDALTERAATSELGPSLAKSPAAFRAEYGSDDGLLATQNRIIAQQRSLAA